MLKWTYLRGAVVSISTTFICTHGNGAKNLLQDVQNYLNLQREMCFSFLKLRNKLKPKSERQP